MTSVEDMTLDLPDPIEAEPGEIRSGADDLTELHDDMLGRSGDTDSQMRASADQFTDRIAWDISSASADELMAWEEASKALTYGAGILRLWAEDIDTYMTDRADIEQRWQVAKGNAQSLRSTITGGVDELFGGDGAAGDLAATREALRSEHAGIWGTLMERAERTKIELRTGPSKETLERMVEAGLLTAGQIATYGDHYPAMVPDEIDGSEPPHLVNAWWDSLSEEEREQAMADDPDLLRDLDGIPSDVRDQLNRDHLNSERDDVKERVDELEAELDELPGGPGHSFERRALVEERDALKPQLQSMNTLLDELGDSSAETDQFLLAFDRGDNGRAILSHGNPDTADNVATMVPGTNTTWESINGQTEYARSVKTESELHGGSTAAISWIGYDAPSYAEAISSDDAENAVDDLSGFQDGLRATHEGSSPSHNTVIGHSYGSTVLGHTAKSEQGLDADDLVLVGSPGTSVDNVHELNFAPENVHATTAGNDHINQPWVLPHGQDPTSDDFGATTFHSNPGPDTGGYFFGDAHGQKEYFKEDVPDEEDHDPLAYVGEVVAGANPNPE